MKGAKVLTVWDQEEMHFIAEEVIVNLRHELYCYDDDGKRAFEGLRKEERAAAMYQAIKKQESLGSEDYLNFPDNEILHRITFSEALEMPLTTIKETYLREVLPKARNIMRKGTMVFQYEVSEEIPDSYLDDLLTLRWRENLKLWAIQWQPGPEGREGGTQPCQTEKSARNAGTL